MAHYDFVTVWRIDAPIEAVWDEIAHPERWPTWWKGVESVVELQPGDERGIGAVRRFTWKSQLPYRLSFDSCTTQIEPPYRLGASASGELAGSGLWQLSEEGGQTVARYDWNVATTKRWMDLLAPLARPLFAWNHNVSMGWGAEGLSRRLGARVESREVA